MSNMIFRCNRLYFFGLFLFVSFSTAGQSKENNIWKAGVATILREGGYEGHSFQMVYGLPSTWASDIETVILHEMVQLAKKANVEKIE